MRPLEQIIRTNAEADRIMRQHVPSWFRESAYPIEAVTEEPVVLGPPMTEMVKASEDADLYTL